MGSHHRLILPRLGLPLCRRVDLLHVPARHLKEPRRPLQGHRKPGRPCLLWPGRRVPHPGLCIRQANLASSGMHYVAVYGFPYNRQAYASSSTSFQFETSYERFFEDESPALSLSPSLILTLLVSLLSLFVVMF